MLCNSNIKKLNYSIIGCVLSKGTVIQLNLQCQLLFIASRLTPCYYVKKEVLPASKKMTMSFEYKLF